MNDPKMFYRPEIGRHLRGKIRMAAQDAHLTEREFLTKKLEKLLANVVF